MIEFSNAQFLLFVLNFKNVENRFYFKRIASLDHLRMRIFVTRERFWIFLRIGPLSLRTINNACCSTRITRTSWRGAEMESVWGAWEKHSAWRNPLRLLKGDLYCFTGSYDNTMHLSASHMASIARGNYFPLYIILSMSSLTVLVKCIRKNSKFYFQQREMPTLGWINFYVTQLASPFRLSCMYILCNCKW